jgi:hypothetical protein
MLDPSNPQEHFMQKPQKPDVQPWEPELEPAPVPNPFVNVTTPGRSVAESEEEDEDVMDPGAPADDPISPVVD